MHIIVYILYTQTVLNGSHRTKVEMERAKTDRFTQIKNKKNEKQKSEHHQSSQFSHVNTH